MGPAHGPPTSPTLLAALAGPADEAAWRTFVDRYAPLVLDHCRQAGLRAADAEEVRDRVLAKLVTALARMRYDPARSFRGYLRAVVRSAAAGYWKEQGRPGATGLGGDDPLPDGPAAVGADALGEAVDAAVSAQLELVARVVARVRRAVRPDTWQAYWQTAVDGVAAPAVARELGKSVGAVYMARHRVAGLLAAEGKALAAGGDAP